MNQLEVEFRADAAGTFPMTWGQQDFWRHKIRRYGAPQHRHFNIPVVVDLIDEAGGPGDTDQAVAAAAALRRLVERNQSLRAHFTDAAGTLLQQIAGSGTFTPRIEQSTAAAEWGVRFALVCVGQSARHLAFAISHLVADGGGLRVLIDDFRDLLRAGDDGAQPQRRWQPSDQVSRELSERGDRRTKAAIRHWRKHLEQIPPSMFGSALPATSPRFQRLRMDSRALAHAAARPAADCQVPVASTILAAATLALTALTG